MGVVRAGNLETAGQSNAQVVGGSLRFDSSKSQYLARTVTSTGNRRTFTYSCWIKLTYTGSDYKHFGMSADTSGGSNPRYTMWYTPYKTFGATQNPTGGSNDFTGAPGFYRDYSGWHHIVMAYDLTQGANANQLKIYINGVLQSNAGQTGAGSSPTYVSNQDTPYNTSGNAMNIGRYSASPSDPSHWDGYMSQIYWIDGQQLDASYFGYIDPLTNTWRPKKFDITKTPGGSYGTNGFYLPLDGSAPIGRDQSGRGNNWTPVNFGGSAALDKATGALPILNTDGGGKVARVGVRTDAYASSLVLAVPFVGIATDVSNLINSGSTQKVLSVYEGSPTLTSTNSKRSNFYGGSLDLGTTSQRWSYQVAASNDFSFGLNPWTIEFWAYRETNAVNSEFNPIWELNGLDGLGVGWLAFLGSNGSVNNLYYGYSSSHTYVSWDLSPINQWVHTAVVFDGSYLMIFDDGVCKVRTAYSSLSGPPAYFGRNGRISFGTQNYSGDSDNRNFGGQIQDFRIYKGVAKYTAAAVGESSFIPASTDPDIVPDSPSGVSYSSNLIPVTDGTVTFDGSGDRLTVNSSDFVFGTSSFTVEAFIYKTNTDAEIFFSQFLNTSNGRDGVALGYQNGAFWILQGNGSTWNLETTVGSFPTNKWIHLAVSRDYSQTKTYYFIDGQLVYTYTSNINLTASNNGDTVIGNAGTTSETYAWTGFISNLHVVKGTALYTSNFTPPSGPISSVANTKLLCCQSNISPNAVSVSPGSYSNGGTTWSSAGNFSGDVRSQSDAAGPQNMFNGLIGDENAPYAVCFAPYSSNSTCTWTSPISFTGLSSLRIYAALSGTNGKLTVNGTDYSSLVTALGSGGAGWVTISQSSLTTITFGYTGGLNSATGIAAVEVNGTVLIDNFNGKAIARAANAAATNFNPFTANINTQRGKSSGYATLNPLNKLSNATLSNGNLSFITNNPNRTGVKGNVGVSTGKWYFELYKSTNNSGSIGFGTDASSLTEDGYVGDGTSWGYLTSGDKRNGGTSSSYGSSWTTGDTVSAALDLDNGQISFYKNGVNQGTAYTNVQTYNTFLVPIVYTGNSTASSVDSVNFGQKPFKFPPPAGFQPLTLANTPRPTIVRPDQYVGIVTFTGNGSTLSVNVGFKPDFVWIKDRDTTYQHNLYDTVRGATKALESNGTDPEYTLSGLTSFDPAGFTLGSNAGNNQSGSPNVAWCWKAGGNSNTFNIDDVGYATASAAGLTAGTKTPTGASVNTKSGFSIIAFTGNQNAGTISHGLGRAPSFYIVRTRDSNSGGSNDWYCYHSALGASARIQLNSTAAQTTGSSQWNSTSPTSSVLSLGSGTWQETGDRFIIYAWAEIPGFSKFGSYSGGTNPTFVHCGFKPAYILIKGNLTSNWVILDNQRDKYNTMTQKLYADTNTQENVSNPAGDSSSANNVDFVSNGFVLRSTNTWTNGSSYTYIYAAFAEAPTFNLYGGQANAR